MSLRACDRLLGQISLLKPGDRLTDFEDRLGGKMYETDDLDLMIKLGPLTDRSFLEGKRLVWFYSSAPPGRVLAVYTSEGDRVSFVTWQGL